MKHKKVLDNFLLGFMIVTLCASGLSKESTVESKWTTAPVKIDGLNNDWTGDPLTLEKKVKVEYSFKNDSENLYVLFIFREPREFMSTISQTGMTIWLNTEGKKKKDYGIRFRRKIISADVYISLLEKEMGPLPEQKKKEIREAPTYRLYQNEVIDEKAEDFMVTGGPTSPAFRSKRGQGMVTYEFRIPLKRGEGQPVGIGTEPGKNIKIGFQWGGLTKELAEQRIKQQGASGTKGRESGGSVTIRERFDGSMRGLSDMSSIRRGAKKYSFWVDVKLAQNQ